MLKHTNCIYTSIEPGLHRTEQPNKKIIFSLKFLQKILIRNTQNIVISHEIYGTHFLPVCLACHDFLLRQTAFKNGNNEGIPRALATTANARAVVLRTYSSILSISGLIVEIIVAKPAALAKFDIISRPSTLA